MVVAVASGKGGTGKTLVSTSLALAMSDKPVQLIDCDVEEPNSHIFLKPRIEQTEKVCTPIPVINEAACTHCGECARACQFNALAVLQKQVMVFENLCHGCGACMLACPEDAISEKEREVGVIETGNSNGVKFAHGKLNIGEAMAPPVIRELKKRIDRECETVIDVSPGTSCPVIESVRDADFVLLVTEPTPFGLNDLKLAVEMLQLLKLPCAVIVNRSGLGDSGVEDYCKDKGIPVILRIPFDEGIAKGYSRGIPLVEIQPEWRSKLREVYEYACANARKR
jgi:MinD superfamily P-loop ATPase